MYNVSRRKKEKNRKEEKDEGMSGMLKKRFTFFFLSPLFLFSSLHKDTHSFCLFLSLFFPLGPSALLTVVSLHLTNMHARAESNVSCHIERHTLTNFLNSFKKFLKRASCTLVCTRAESYQLNNNHSVCQFLGLLDPIYHLLYSRRAM